WSQIHSTLHWGDIRGSLLKAAVFGAAVSWIAVYQGYHAEPTSEGVSRATTSTVVISSLAILALDFILTAFMFR
ncbi:MAG: ABC transporter permease, partial [Stenotrophobium sp.]